MSQQQSSVNPLIPTSISNAIQPPFVQPHQILPQLLAQSSSGDVVSQASTNPMNPLLAKSMVNSASANLISQLANSISGAMLTLAQSAANGISPQDASENLKGVVQLLAAMTNLTANLNNSVSEMMASMAAEAAAKSNSNQRLLTFQIVPPPTPAAMSEVQENGGTAHHAEGTLKSLLTQAPTTAASNGDSEEENIPTKNVHQQLRPLKRKMEKVPIPSLKSARRLLGTTVEVDHCQHRTITGNSGKVLDFSVGVKNSMAINWQSMSFLFVLDVKPAI